MVRIPLSCEGQTAFVHLQSSAFDPNTSIQVLSRLQTTKSIGSQLLQIWPAQDILITLTEMGKAKPLQNDFILLLRKVDYDGGKLFAGQNGIGAWITCLNPHPWHFYFEVFSVESRCYFNYSVRLNNANRAVHGWTRIILLGRVFESCIKQVLFLRCFADHVDGFCSQLEQVFKGASDDLVLHVSYYNMLRIEVQRLSLERKIEGKLQVEVEGSKSGKLASDPVYAVSPEWNPYFRVDCNHNDKLVFRVMAIDAGKASDLGLCELYCAKFIKENRKKLSSDDPTEYNLDILNGQIFEGTLNTYIWFDPTLSFQGEFPQNISLSLNSFNEPLPVYMGKCATSNAFSFLDKPAEGQYCKFSESIYRDHQ